MVFRTYTLCVNTACTSNTVEAARKRCGTVTRQRDNSHVWLEEGRRQLGGDA